MFSKILSNYFYDTPYRVIVKVSVYIFCQNQMKIEDALKYLSI